MVTSDDVNLAAETVSDKYKMNGELEWIYDSDCMGFMLPLEKRPPASKEFLDSPKDLGVKG